MQLYQNDIVVAVRTNRNTVLRYILHYRGNNLRILHKFSIIYSIPYEIRCTADNYEVLGTGKFNSNYPNFKLSE